MKPLRKCFALLLALALLTGCASAFAEGDVLFWHTLEEMYRADLGELVNQYEHADQVTVEYQGRVAEILQKVLAANVQGGSELPSVFPVHSSEIKNLARDGVVENLDPYIEKYGTDLTNMNMKDVYAYEGSQYGLTWTITGISVFYNKTIAEQEGIAFPKTWDEMDEFLHKATKKNADGTTARYAMWIPGWDSYYFTWIFWNFGVVTVDEEGNSTLNSEKAAQIVAQVKGWIDEGLIMWGYGSNGSSNMRSAFWAGEAFAIFHTSSQYKNHYDNMLSRGYEVGVAVPPAGDTANTTEIFGMSLCIPAKLDESKKDDAYQLLQYLCSKDTDCAMASFTGFLANYSDAMETEAGKAFLAEYPEMANLYDHIADMTCAVQLPCYTAITDVMEEGLAQIFLENADMQATLDYMVDEIAGLYEDSL
ncbi:MAG: extracellular solute-binding protein [Clostridia bacterium]|nr:extracellular solute-binding protein [Clostridia bacterium]